MCSFTRPFRGFTLYDSEQIQDAIHYRLRLVEPLKARRADVLVDDKEAAGPQRRRDLVEQMLQRVDVVESLHRENDVVRRGLQLHGVEVSGSVGDRIRQTGLLGVARRNLERFLGDIKPTEGSTDSERAIASRSTVPCPHPRLRPRSTGSGKNRRFVKPSQSSCSLPVISRLMWRSVSGWDCQ